MICLSLKPRDPVVARDGRPFGANQGHHMRSLDWPYPSVLAGSLRTLLGKLTNGSFTEQIVTALKEVQIGGPFPLVGDRLFFPAPRDITFRRNEDSGSSDPPLQAFARRPFGLMAGEGVNLPEGLWPLELSPVPPGDFKPIAGPAFWSENQMSKWLSVGNANHFEVPPDVEGVNEGESEVLLLQSGYLEAPAKDRRTHAQIEADTLAAKEGRLFSTTSLALSDGVELAVRVSPPAQFTEVLNHLSSFHPFGGERRLVHWSRAEGIEHQWECPDAVREALKGTPGVRMILATPALFRDGWRPGWIGQDMVGTVPGTQVRLRLEAAAIDRWKPISGWSLESNGSEKPGPKPIRRLVPAGAVYFLNVEDGDIAELADSAWLESVCDELQERRDGFGLALWGVWDGKLMKGGV